MQALRSLRPPIVAAILGLASVSASSCGSASPPADSPALGRRSGEQRSAADAKPAEASRGLREGKPTGAPARALGVTYGPYLGVRCRRADHIGCDRVGIDIVLSDPAIRAEAVVAGRRLRLRTPGFHSGVRFRDWVGTVQNAGMRRPDSPFRVRGHGRGHRLWAGSPPLYVPVELRVRLVGGRQEAALFPRVFVSPGWG